MRIKILTTFIIAIIFVRTVCYAAPVTVYRTANSEGYEVTTPQQYVFRLDGSDMEFVLLDEMEDGYLVMTKMHIAPRWPFDPDNTGKFDIDDENNIAWWLNNDYLDKTIDGVTPLPDAIKEHLVEHEWLTEAGNENTDFTEDYMTKCKVALPSMTEWIKYCYNERKIGTSDDGRNGFWMLRSSDGINTNLSEPYTAGILVGTYMGTATWGKAVSGAAVRPIFVLDKDFFASEKLSIKHTGGVVLQLLIEQLGAKKLAAVYNNTQIINQMNKYIKPVAKSVKYRGITIVGRTIEGEYEYFSPNGAAERGTVFRWLRSSEENGTYTPIQGATGKKYTLTEADENKYLKFEVIPKTAINMGRAARSKAWKIYPETAPVVTETKIVGVPHNGTRLYVDYHLTEASNEPVSNVYYQWQISDDGKMFRDIPGATEMYFTPGDDLCGKYVRVSVQGEKMSDGSYLRGDISLSEPLLLISKPKAERVSLSGVDTLTGSYTYSEPLNKNEGKSICFWEVSANGQDAFKTVAYGNSIRIPMLAEDCLLRFSVIPLNSDGTIGDKASSEPIFIKKSVFPEGSNKAIDGADGQISINRASFYSGIVIELISDYDNLNFASNLFEITKLMVNGKYIIVLKARNTEAVYVNGPVLTISAEQGSGSILLQNVYANDAIKTGGVNNITDFVELKQH